MKYIEFQKKNLDPHGSPGPGSLVPGSTVYTYPFNPAVLAYMLCCSEVPLKCTSIKIQLHVMLPKKCVCHTMDRKK